MRCVKCIVSFLSVALLSIGGCAESVGRKESANSRLEQWPSLEVQQTNMEAKYRNEILNTEIHTFAEFKKLESTADAGSGLYGSLKDRLERKSLLGARRRNWYVANTPSLPVRIRETILEGSLVLGMTEEQVLASWGWPRDTNRTVAAFGTMEQWVYGYYIAERNGVTYTHFLYFNDGLLTSWQDLDVP